MELCCLVPVWIHMCTAWSWSHRMTVSVIWSAGVCKRSKTTLVTTVRWGEGSGRKVYYIRYVQVW